MEEAIIEKSIKEEVFSDNYEYFFSFLTDRFEYATELWIKELEKKFNKKFKPIWILSAKQNEFFPKENYIVINKKLEELKKKSKTNSIIYLEDYEDMNKEFSDSLSIRGIILRLLKKQEKVFILGFTSSCLEVYNPNVIILGPNPSIATKFDNKIKQIKLFNWLNIPRNKTRVYKTIEEIKSNENYPFFISASYTSGGHESKAIFDKGGLEIFYSTLREINKNSEFLVADLIEDIFLSPNVNAIIINEKSTKIICITDQILRDNVYLGNIYPSRVNNKQKEKIIQITKQVGNYLGYLGFRGLFGLDFIINSKGDLFTVDLNPRRQGGYFCNIQMSKINIPEIELRLALGEKVPDFDYLDFQIDYAWAHTKLKPYYENTKITNCFKHGEFFLPFSNIGEIFKCIFYPKNSLLASGNGGYIILTGTSHEEVKQRIIKEAEIAISKNFELYGG